jgi:hypothetical protein
VDLHGDKISAHPALGTNPATVDGSCSADDVTPVVPNLGLVSDLPVLFAKLVSRLARNVHATTMMKLV